MGSYSYICKECGKPLKGDCCNGGDNCVLIHIRHSVVEGFTKGHYNEYGGVIEENALPESERFDSVVPAIEAAFVKLPKTECDTHSGIAAYHAKCFNKAAKVDAISLVPSDIYDF